MKYLIIFAFIFLSLLNFGLSGNPTKTAMKLFPLFGAYCVGKYKQNDDSWETPFKKIPKGSSYDVRVDSARCETIVKSNECGAIQTSTTYSSSTQVQSRYFKCQQEMSTMMSQLFSMSQLDFNLCSDNGKTTIQSKQYNQVQCVVPCNSVQQNVIVTSEFVKCS